jgi:hypothetical protein
MHLRTGIFLRKNSISLLALIVILAGSIVRSLALDIGPMTWTPRADWINVKSCAKLTGGPNATGDGTADDTAALQATLAWVQAHNNSQTIYFPAGTYKITGTLKITQVSGVTLLGCGSRTILSWAGPRGGAMFLPSATHHMVYEGLTWEGNNLASCAYEHASQAVYETNIRHENESFRNFTAVATYSFLDPKGNTVTTPTPPTAAILAGFPTTSGGGLTGETMVYNCAFHHCTMGIVQAWDVGNNFMWHVDGCQFEDCDYGINFFMSACNDVDNCHFEHSKTCDVMGGHSMHVRHCTSHASGQFYNTYVNCPLSADILEDCWVDGWTDPTGAVQLGIPGPNVIFDCHFSHPPAKAQPPIHLKPLTNLPPQLLLSNNREAALADAALVNHGPDHVVTIPAGRRGSVLTSARQTFLNSRYPAESRHVLDVTKPPYSADNTFKGDTAGALQKAIDAARRANDGTIVYLPDGLYKVGSTLTVHDGNYTIAGEGFGTMLAWIGPGKSAVFDLRDPHRTTIRQMRIAVPTGQDVASVRVTAGAPCTALLDEITSSGLAMGNPGASGDANNEPGLVFDHLPAGSKVYLPHVDTPITGHDSGAARILSKYLAIGEIHVSGTVSDTGFLGVQVLEGGQQDPKGRNIDVDDNQSLVIGDYYSEQCGNDLRIARGNGTGAGHVAIQGFLTASGNNNGSGAATTTVEMDNYQGRLFYGSAMMADYNGSLPVQITQTGTNPLDLVLVANTFSHSLPTITITSAKVVQTLNVNAASYPGSLMPDVPNPLTSTAKLAISRALDDMRELEAVDLNVEFGLGEQAIPTPNEEETTP